MSERAGGAGYVWYMRRREDCVHIGGQYRIRHIDLKNEIVDLMATCNKALNNLHSHHK